jgi:hypothetical protein
MGGSYRTVFFDVRVNEVGMISCFEPLDDVYVSEWTRLGTSRVFGVRPARKTLSEVAIVSTMSMHEISLGM